MGVQLYSHEEGNKQGELRCRVYVYLIQSPADWEYFDHGSAEGVFVDTCASVFRNR